MIIIFDYFHLKQIYMLNIVQTTISFINFFRKNKFVDLKTFFDC